MLAANIIHQPRSPWSFPVVVVDKRDGMKRFSTDFRKLNNISKKPRWPLPVIDYMLGALGEATCFTTLDLKSGSWQIPLNANLLLTLMVIVPVLVMLGKLLFMNR